ncbi:MAG TPA: CYTH domain-containing protein [Myxococcaceae bacterium]|nr:CYTH domain-containing protein [Myxococcaceae bacterium]
MVNGPGRRPSAKWVQLTPWSHSQGEGAGKEIEFKYRVQGDAALKALAAAAGGKATPAKQFSHFFDTGNQALTRSGYMLRVSGEFSEEHNNLWLVTAKGRPGKTSYASLSDRQELEVAVPEHIGRQVLDGTLSPLSLLEWHPSLDREGRQLLEEVQSRVKNRPLTHVGAFENDRTRVPLKLSNGKEVKLELDRTRFPGQTHYEVEVEVPQGVDVNLTNRELQKLFAQAKVSAFPSTSKADRLFEILQKTGRPRGPAPAPKGEAWWRGPSAALQAWSGRSSFAAA